MNRISRVLLGLGLALQGGCVTDRTGSAERMLSGGPPFGPPDRLAEAPLASLPAAAGRVVAVQTVRTDASVMQKIVLQGDGATAGENTVEVETTPAPMFGEAVAKPVRTEQIAAELASRFPGVAMQVADQPVPSEAGSLGVAAGHAGASTCVYAWRNPRPATDGERLSLRVRLCRTMSLDRLLALIADLRVSGAPGRARDAEPPPLEEPDRLSSVLPPRRMAETAWLRTPDADPPSASDVVVVPRRAAHRTDTADVVRPRRIRAAARHRAAPADRMAVQAHGIEIPLPGPTPVLQASPRRSTSTLADLPLPAPESAAPK